MPSSRSAAFRLGVPRSRVRWTDLIAFVCAPIGDVIPVADIVQCGLDERKALRINQLNRSARTLKL